MSFDVHNRTTQNVKGWRVKEPVVRETTSVAPRVDLKIEDFETAIEQKGVAVKVYRTSYCPNVRSIDAGEHDINCSLCKGSGWLDRHPLCTKAYIQTQELDKPLHVEGFSDGNHVMMTFPIGVELQYFTLVQLEDFTDIFMQRVMRAPIATTAVDVLKYSACRVNMLVDSSGVEYFQDIDFKIDRSGNVRWITGKRRPADYTPYTIHYEARVQYRALRALHVNRFTQIGVGGNKVSFVKLPEQWLMSKEFLIRRLDKDGNDTPQGPFDNHTIVTEPVEVTPTYPFSEPFSDAEWDGGIGTDWSEESDTATTSTQINGFDSDEGAGLGVRFSAPASGTSFVLSNGGLQDDPSVDLQAEILCRFNHVGNGTLAYTFDYVTSDTYYYRLTLTSVHVSGDSTLTYTLTRVDSSGSATVATATYAANLHAPNHYPFRVRFTNYSDTGEVDCRNIVEIKSDADWVVLHNAIDTDSDDLYSVAKEFRVGLSSTTANAGDTQDFDSLVVTEIAP